MPPRWLTIVIILTWLLVSGQLLVRDLLPRLLPGQPPPFTIDLVEEARTRRVYVDWAVSHGNRRVFRARCRVLHPEHDVFELTAEFTPEQGTPRVPLHGMLIRRLNSVYRVNGTGDLLGVAVQIEGTPQLAQAVKLLGDADIRVDIEGEVRNGRLKPTLRFELTRQRLGHFSLPEVRIRGGGSVLLPLHPVNRLEGLVPGQRWQMTAIDPLGDSLSALQGGGGEAHVLRASVRPEVELLGRGRRREVPCLVIDYEGDDFRASTWVDRDRGLVLCQEATLGGDNWVMVRE